MFGRILLLGVCLFLLQSSFSIAGGFNIRWAELDGRSFLTAKPGDPIQFCINGDNYTYGSSSSAEKSFLILFVVPRYISSYDISGLASQHFDGWFPGLSVHLLPLELGSHNIATEDVFCTYITAPILEGEYNVFVDPMPYFALEDVATFVTPNTVVLHRSAFGDILNHVNFSRLQRLEDIDLLVDSGFTEPPKKPEVYLQINNQTPGTYGGIVKSGYSEQPIRFTWIVTEGNGLEIQHRYALFQVDEAFSHWTEAKHAEYNFVYPGGHVFRVQTRYRYNTSSDWKEASEARFAFNLDKPFVAGSFTKGYGKGAKAAPISINLANYYSKDSALVISVSEFLEDKFAALPYTETDKVTVHAALKKGGFDVEMLSDRSPSSKQVKERVSSFLRSLETGSRALIYLSTHGFQDDFSGRPYLATSDCNPEKPDSSCISMLDLEPLIEAAATKAQHILLVVDACSAGLGTVSKAFYEQAAFDQSGSHVLTAGLANQEAQIDVRTGQSVFTKKFLDAISGGADLNKDKIVTLVELFHYVWKEVAKQTQGAQVPSIGRIKGAGEMMFNVVGSP